MKELDFTYIYDNTLKGYNKILMMLSNLSTDDIDALGNMVDNFDNLILFYRQTLKRNYRRNTLNPVKFLRGKKKYNKYINLLGLMVNNLDEIFNQTVEQMKYDEMERNTPAAQKSPYVKIAGFTLNK